MNIPRTLRHSPSPPPEDKTSPSLQSYTLSNASGGSSPQIYSHSGYNSSPDIHRAFDFQDVELTPFSLPEPTVNSSSTITVMTSTTTTETSSFGKPGLIRRLSSAGRGRLRGRTSTTNLKNTRDQNLGSVVRRRSDVRTTTDGAGASGDEHEPSIHREEDDDHTPLATAAIPTANIQRPRLFSLTRRSSNSESTLQRTPPRGLSRRPSTVDNTKQKTTIIIPKTTTFTKIGRKKKKQLRFTLDDVAGKMYWSSSSSSRTKQIYVDDIREIRAGADAVNYMEAHNEAQCAPGCWLTIIYIDPERSKGRSMKLMHIIAEDEATCDKWHKALQHVMNSRDARMEGLAVNNEKHWLAQWRTEMVKRFGQNDHPDSDEKIDLATLRKICRSVSIFKSASDIQAIFTSIGGLRTGTINKAQYVEFFRRLTERRELRYVFEQAKKTQSSTLTEEDFLDFLSNHQGVVISHLTRQYWEDIYTKYAQHEKSLVHGGPSDTGLVSGTGMSFDGFSRFLSSSTNNVLAPKPASGKLTRPLNEYFISSSHNTYLQGRQIWGESSPEMYTEALKRGCRCIEIDCDNGVDGKPVVTHVKTATTRVPFLDCIKAIDQYAFFASDYPLIVSLEVHCNSDQQKIMANIMTTVFGSKLLLHPLTPNDYTLPSPEELKGRILVKVKLPRPDEPVATSPVAKKQVHTRTRSISAPGPPPAQPTFGPKMVVKSPTALKRDLTSQVGSIVLADASSSFGGETVVGSSRPSLSGSEDSDGSTETVTSPRKTKHISNIVKELGELGVYTRGAKFSTWDSVESNMPNHVYSFNESTFEARCAKKDGKVALETHNRSFLMRVYPKATRWQSGNFTPLQFWRRGVQMCATNWQTYDLGTQLNDAMFAAGMDKTGYVLKPSELRRSRESITGERLKIGRKHVKFTVNVISAQYLEAPSDMRHDAEMNPHVVLEMFYPEDKGKDADTDDTLTSATPLRSAKSSTKRTETVQGNGYDPIFDAEEQNTFVMSAVTKHPSLIFVRFSVFLNNRSEPICTFTGKLVTLGHGYRHLPLYSRNGELLHSKLFVKLVREEPRPWGPEGDGTLPGAQESTGRQWRKWLPSRTPSGRKPAGLKDGKGEDDKFMKEQESGYFSQG